MALRFLYTPSAVRDLKSLKREHDTRSLNAIAAIEREIERTWPEAEGRFSPEALGGDLAGCLSRRINQRDRFVYRTNVAAGTVEVLQCRGHYGDH